MSEVTSRVDGVRVVVLRGGVVVGAARWDGQRLVEVEHLAGSDVHAEMVRLEAELRAGPWVVKNDADPDLVPHEGDWYWQSAITGVAPRRWAKTFPSAGEARRWLVENGRTGTPEPLHADHPPAPPRGGGR